MNCGKSVARRVQEAAVPVVVRVPAQALTRVKDGLLLGNLLAAEINNEGVTVVPLTDWIDPVFSTADINDLGPGRGGKVFRRDFSMSRQVVVRAGPSGLVVFVVVETHPEILHPSIDVLRLDGIVDVQPAFRKEVLRFVLRQVLILSRHTGVTMYVKKNAGGNEKSGTYAKVLVLGRKRAVLIEGERRGVFYCVTLGFGMHLILSEPFTTWIRTS